MHVISRFLTFVLGKYWLYPTLLAVLVRWDLPTLLYLQLPGFALERPPAPIPKTALHPTHRRTRRSTKLLCAICRLLWSLIQHNYYVQIFLEIVTVNRFLSHVTWRFYRCKKALSCCSSLFEAYKYTPCMTSINGLKNVLSRPRFNCWKIL